MLKALVSLQMLFGYSLFLEKTKEKQEFFYQEGIKEYLHKKNEKKKGLHPIAMFSDYSNYLSPL